MTEEPIAATGGDTEAADQEELKWPAGFITVMVLAALYVGWRLVQLTYRFIDWLI